jgi:hypothetical protein
MENQILKILFHLYQTHLGKKGNSKKTKQKKVAGFHEDVDALLPSGKKHPVNLRHVYIGYVYIGYVYPGYMYLGYAYFGYV